MGPLWAGALLASVPARAQPFGEGSTLRGDPSRAGFPDPGVPLSGRFGVDRATTLLESASLDDVRLGLERLGAIGTPEALARLVEVLEAGHRVRNAPLMLLHAVRALAPHAREDAVSKALAAVFSDASGGLAHPHAILARDVAAIALARAGTPASLTPLVTAVIGRGPAAASAREALLAFPLPSLESMLEGRGGLSWSLVDLLGALGDVRAIGPLRGELKGKGERSRAASALALARLGDHAGLEVARKLAVSTKSSPSVRRDATEALLLLDDRDAFKSVATLIGGAATRPLGLQLAALAPSPALVPTLAAVVSAEVPVSQKRAAVAVLARAGSDRAASALGKVLAEPELAPAAAMGLASSRAPAAARILARALAAAPAGPPRRLMLRAGIVRHVELGDTLPGLAKALDDAFGSGDAADRSVGAFGAALLGRRPLAELLRSADPVVLAAACRAALAGGTAALAEIEPLLSGLVEPGSEPDARVLAGAVALLARTPSDGEQGRVSTHALARWAETGGPLAVPAAYQLAVRDSRPFRPRLLPLLSGTDALVRAHVAAGLGRSPEPDAVALLAGAYAMEVDASTRRAIVRALAMRPEAKRRRTLELARDTDPDAAIRGLAGAALAGQRVTLDAEPLGRRVAMVSVRANHASQEHQVAARPVLLIRTDGLALPLLTSPDGVVLVPGLAPHGEVSVRLAPRRSSGDG